jgi:hypothetical protein
MTNAAAGICCGAREHSGVASRGRGTAAGGAGGRVLSPQSADDDYINVTVPFLQGLKETGYVVGQNVAFGSRLG